MTGERQQLGTFLPDSIYAAALDALVICCADAAIVHQGLWLIAKRAWEPHPDWWVIGGRMRKGELIEQALQRNLRRELHLDLPEDRLRMIIGYYSQIWDTRAWEPTTNGCHVFSITTAVHKARLRSDSANCSDFNSCLGSKISMSRSSIW